MEGSANLDAIHVKPEIELPDVPAIVDERVRVILPLQHLNDTHTNIQDRY